MNRSRTFAALAATSALAAASLAASAAAHHSAAMFESDRTITLEGVVKEFQYTNPHSWLLVDVTDENGEVTTWGFEAEGPSTLMRAGIRRSSIPVGSRITITGRPMRDGRPAAAWVRAVLEDGSEINPFAGFTIR
jgi:hypothetical protein